MYSSVRYFILREIDLSFSISHVAAVSGKQTTDTAGLNFRSRTAAQQSNEIINFYGRTEREITIGAVTY